MIQVALHNSEIQHQSIIDITLTDMHHLWIHDHALLKNSDIHSSPDPLPRKR